MRLRHRPEGLRQERWDEWRCGKHRCGGLDLRLEGCEEWWPQKIRRRVHSSDLPSLQCCRPCSVRWQNKYVGICHDALRHTRFAFPLNCRRQALGVHSCCLRRSDPLLENPLLLSSFPFAVPTNIKVFFVYQSKIYLHRKHRYYVNTLLTHQLESVALFTTGS